MSKQKKKSTPRHLTVWVVEAFIPESGRWEACAGIALRREESISLVKEWRDKTQWKCRAVRYATTES